MTPPDFRFTIDALLADSFFDSAQKQETSSASAAGPASANKSSALRNRSTSRNREMQADPSFFEQGAALAHPKGSRSLQYTGEAEQEQRGRPTDFKHPAGSSILQMQQGSDGKPMALPKGSMSLQLDPAYFKNARSRTISPSRSYVIDSSAFASFTLDDDEERGRGRRGGPTGASPAESPTRARSSSATRGRSGFRSIGGGDDAIPEDAELPTKAAAAAPSSGPNSVQKMAQRWQKYLQEGKFKLSVPPQTKLSEAADESNVLAAGFWTSPYAFADMPKKDTKLVEELRKSDLVVFKGEQGAAYMRGKAADSGFLYRRPQLPQTYQRRRMATRHALQTSTRATSGQDQHPGSAHVQGGCLRGTAAGSGGVSRKGGSQVADEWKMGSRSVLGEGGLKENKMKWGHQNGFSSPGTSKRNF